MAMCTKCGTENHDSLEKCLYCGTTLSMISMESEQLNPEIISNQEFRDRIIEDQYEKILNTRIIYLTYLLALLLPFVFFGLGSQHPRIKDNPHYKKLKPFALFGSLIYGIATAVILLNEFEIIKL